MNEHVSDIVSVHFICVDTHSPVCKVKQESEKAKYQRDAKSLQKDPGQELNGDCVGKFAMLWLFSLSQMMQKCD